MSDQPKIAFLRPKLPSWPRYRGHLEEIDRTRVYSNFGPLVTRLEEEIVARLFRGVGRVATVANATLGLILAINAVRRPGARYALMPSFTFAATPLAAMWCGLTPYFVDIRPGDWALDEEKLRTSLSLLGEGVAVVVPYATFGTSIDLSFYADLHQAGAPVVVDAAPGAGAFDDGSHFGAGMPGAVVYSLHATKPFGVGEGGFVYSATEPLIDHVHRCSNFGFDDDRVSSAPGLNAKMSEYTAAIGLEALGELAEKGVARRQIYDFYLEEFSDALLHDEGWELHKYTGGGAPQFMSLLSPPDVTGRAVVDELARLGIEARTYFWPPCHMQPSFSTACRDELPQTEQVAGRVVSLPLWLGMTRGDVRRIIEAMRLVGTRVQRTAEGVLNVD